MVIRFDKNILFHSVILILCCIPTIAFSEMIRTIFNGAYIIVFIASIFCFIYNNMISNRRLYKVWLWVFIIIFSSLINSVNHVSFFRLAIIIFSTVTIVYSMLSYNSEMGIKSILYIFTMLSIIHLISVITHCFGYSNDIFVNRYMYFFGIRVDFDGFFLVSNFIAAISFQFRDKICRLCSLILVAICVWFVLYEKISTALIAGMVFWFIVLITKIRFNETIWKIILVAIGIVSIFIVINYRYLNKFAWIIVYFTGKDATLNGRTQVWQQVIEGMKGWHWIIGNGYMSKGVFRLGSISSGRYVHSTHSQYLAALYSFGIVGLANYLSIILETIKNYHLIKNDANSINQMRVIIAVSVSVLVMGISTTFIYEPYIYIYIAIAIFLTEGNIDLLRMRGQTHEE